MFYVVKDLTRTVIIHPKYAYKDQDDTFFTTVKRKSYFELEGTFDPFYGYIVTVIKFNHISKEVIINSDGMLEVEISAKVICQIPEIGEIVDAVVKSMSRASIIATFCGIISCTIKSSEFGDDDYVYMKMEKKDDEKNSSQTSAYFYFPGDPSKNIKIGSVVRVKIEERMIGSQGYFCTATMNDGVNKFLGVIKPLVVNSKTADVVTLVDDDQACALEDAQDPVLPISANLCTLAISGKGSLVDENQASALVVQDPIPSNPAGDKGTLVDENQACAMEDAQNPVLPNSVDDKGTLADENQACAPEAIPDPIPSNSVDDKGTLADEKVDNENKTIESPSTATPSDQES